MSVLTIDPGRIDDLTPESAISDRMPGGIALSATLHVGLVVLILVGLPTLFRPPPPQDQPIAVELVNIGPETHATHPNPNRPVPDAKPDVIPLPLPPAPVPPPKPAPPQPSAEPPSSSAAPPPPPEPPKPEVKPTPTPPPPPPKPEAQAPITPPPPPKPEVKPQPQPKNPQPAFDQLLKKLDQPQKQQNPAQFDSLLKNLAKNDAARTDDAKPQRTHVAAASPPSSQPKAPLGAKLSASEMDLVRDQIARCWNVPAGARDAKDLVVEIRAQVSPDGTVRQATIVDQGRMGDPFYRAAAESARRAFFNPACTPLKLPPDKYDTWKDLVVDFSPKDIL